MQVWYVQLDCKEDGMNASRSSEDDNTLISPPVSCGKDPESPCCNLQHVVDKIQGGDTVYVTQVSADKQSQCNQTLEIQVQVRKSFILKTFMSEKKVDKDSVQGIHGVKLEFSNNCSRLCSLTIGKSYIFCTSLVIKDLDISIKDTQFRESSITAKTHSERQVYRNNMKIQNTEFKNNFPVGVNSAMNFTIVCLVGQWNTVELLRSEFEGDRHSQITGVQVMHANIETLNLIDVQISLMFSALVIRSSNVGIFNITDSIFLGNRDGIDIGQDVRYVMVSRSEMNNTGMWFEDDEALEQCSSAIKGSAQTFRVEDSIFAHNRASGRNCTGAALYVRSNVYEIQGLLPSNNEMYENHNPLIYTIEVVKSVFYANTLKNCSEGLSEGFENGGSGGAIAVYGLQLEIRIMASTFTRNEACKGAGFYLGMLNKGLIENPPKRSAGQILSARISIETCTFIENVAEYGAGLMTELTESILDSGSDISTLIYNSSFLRNNAHCNGAGACLWYLNDSFGSGVAVTIKVSDTDFNENVATGKRPYGQGGAMSMNFTFVTLLSNASLTAVVNTCTFTSNTAGFGAGISTLVKSCSLDSNSFVMSQVTGSTFTYNTAEYWGAGIFTWVDSCSINSNSLTMSQVSGSSFCNNTAGLKGAGIYTWVSSCSVESYSTIMSQVTGSTFIYNTAEYSGAGILAVVRSCSVESNSTIMSQVTGSTFIYNTAGYGTGIHTQVVSCSVESNSSIMSQVTGSVFTYNTAENSGAGIHTGVWSCSVDSNSSLMSQVTESTFTYNTAGYTGAGILTVVSCSLDSTSFLTIQTSSSIFSSNSADTGAGLSVRQIIEDTCVSGKSTVVIDNCQFLTNSASKQGGSLFLNIFFTTHVFVKQSIFVSNRALPGSGLYRENVDVQTCNKDTSDLETQESITTQVNQCDFIDNIDTAILVKSRQRFGSLAISKCSFKNNWCINSSFAEDIFTDMDLELSYTHIVKNKTLSRIIGIHSQSDATLKNVTVDTSVLSIERQISVAVFSHFITQRKHSSFGYECPAFYQPTLSTPGPTDTGAVMVRATCDSCFEGYYTGETWMTISAENNSDSQCYEKQLFDRYQNLAGKNRFCYRKSVGTCIDCPHGGNCTAGVVALPNYWGHMTAAKRLEFHRCPEGYCGSQAQCKGIDQCAAHREGILCGRCKEGFTESLLSQECLPGEECDDMWVLPIFITWAFCVAWAIIFIGELEQLPKKILSRCKQYCCDNGENQENLETWAQIDSFERNFRKKPFHQDVTTQLLATKPEVTQKTPILCGLLNTEQREHIEQSGHLKYLQIILYYIQDSSLLQVNLALDYKDTAIRKIRRVLLNVSQLAVDLLDLGLKLCPIKGWTPVLKIVTKNMTGPLVFFFILKIYLIIRLTCMCFPRKRASLKKLWYPKLTTAIIFSILMFYQQIANTTFSLLYCIKSDGQSILFIDGTVTCYQPSQIVILIFAINWIVAIIPILMFLPGLLELRLIGMKDFFLACLMPGPMLVYWGYRIYKKKFCIHTAYRTPWQDEASVLLQKTFVKTTYKNMFPFCWIGFMKIRRLALVLIFTFVSNLVGRVSLMCFVIVVFMIIHERTQPYQDNVANVAYTASLLATLSIGFINIMKAACVEFYLDLDKVKHSLETLDLITDIIFVYCPPIFIILAIIAFVAGKIRASLGKNEEKSETGQAPIITEDDL